MGWLANIFEHKRHLLVSLTAVAVVAGAALTLASTSQNATISGHVYDCDGGRGSAVSRACAPGEPVAHATEVFELADGTRSFRVTTDLTGRYSVSVPPGTYIVKWEVFGSPAYHDNGRTYTGVWDVKPFTVRAGQHVTLDLTTRAFSL
jgi:hypothetical protein